MDRNAGARLTRDGRLGRHGPARHPVEGGAGAARAAGDRLVDRLGEEEIGEGVDAAVHRRQRGEHRGPVGGVARGVAGREIGVGEVERAVHEGAPERDAVDHGAHRLELGRRRLSIGLAGRQRKAPAQRLDEACQSPRVLAQGALEATADHCAGRLAFAHRVDQLEGIAHPRRRQIDGVGAGAGDVAGEVARAHHGRGGRVIERRRQDVAMTGRPAAGGAQVLHPAESAEVRAGRRRLAHASQPPRGQRGQPGVEPVRADVERLREEAIELGGGDPFERRQRLAVLRHVRGRVAAAVALHEEFADRQRAGDRRDRRLQPLPPGRCLEAAGDADQLAIADLADGGAGVHDVEVERDPRQLLEAGVAQHLVEERVRRRTAARPDLPLQLGDGRLAHPAHVVGIQPARLGQRRRRDQRMAVEAGPAREDEPEDARLPARRAHGFLHRLEDPLARLQDRVGIVAEVGHHVAVPDEAPGRAHAHLAARRVERQHIDQIGVRIARAADPRRVRRGRQPGRPQPPQKADQLRLEAAAARVRFPAVERAHRQDAVRLAAHAQGRQRAAAAHVGDEVLEGGGDRRLADVRGHQLAEEVAEGDRNHRAVHRRAALLFAAVGAGDVGEGRRRDAERGGQATAVAAVAIERRPALDRAAHLAVRIGRRVAGVARVGVVGRRALREERQPAEVVVAVEQTLERARRLLRRQRRLDADHEDPVESEPRVVRRQRHAERHPDLDRAIEIDRPGELVVERETVAGDVHLGLRAGVWVEAERQWLSDGGAGRARHHRPAPLTDHQPPVGQERGVRGAFPGAAPPQGRREARLAGRPLGEVLRTGGERDPGGPRRRQRSNQLVPRLRLGVGITRPRAAPVAPPGALLVGRQRLVVRFDEDGVGVDADPELIAPGGVPSEAGLDPHRQEDGGKARIERLPLGPRFGVEQDADRLAERGHRADQPGARVAQRRDLCRVRGAGALDLQISRRRRPLGGDQAPLRLGDLADQPLAQPQGLGRRRARADDLLSIASVRHWASSAEDRPRGTRPGRAAGA